MSGLTSLEPDSTPEMLQMTEMVVLLATQHLRGVSDWPAWCDACRLTGTPLESADKLTEETNLGCALAQKLSG